jgi:DNA-binding XRE family transcriptional regulator
LHIQILFQTPGQEDKVGKRIMMYARNAKDAERFIVENYAENEVEKTVILCDCGESEGFVIYDEDGKEVDSICICNACWFNSPYHDRIESPGTLDEEDLTNLLGFEPGIYDVKIIKTFAINDEADFIVAELMFEDDEMVVSFIHYRGKEWLFTPQDWQGYMPESPDEIGEIKWRVNNTEQEGILFNGVPRLAPWENDPAITTRKTIGAAIREARESQGLSVRQLADKCGIGKNLIIRIEQAKYNYNIDTLTKIAEALGFKIGLK